MLSTRETARLLRAAGALARSQGQDDAGVCAGERIAAALLIGRPEWSGCEHVLEALARLGPEDLAALIALHRRGAWSGGRRPPVII